MDRAAADRTVKRLARRAGITMRISPHDALRPGPPVPGPACHLRRRRVHSRRRPPSMTNPVGRYRAAGIARPRRQCSDRASPVAGDYRAVGEQSTSRRLRTRRPEHSGLVSVACPPEVGAVIGGSLHGPAVLLRRIRRLTRRRTGAPRRRRGIGKHTRGRTDQRSVRVRTRAIGATVTHR
jgi:hypothetical protein